jgi:hypothetical protein
MAWQVWKRVEPWVAVWFRYRQAARPAGRRRISMVEWRTGLEVGVLDFQVCHQCRVGCVNKVSITVDRQRQGLGGRALRRAIVHGRGYDWSTSGQSPEGRGFFAAMARRTRGGLSGARRRLRAHQAARSELPSRCT